MADKSFDRARDLGAPLKQVNYELEIFIVDGVDTGGVTLHAESVATPESELSEIELNFGHQTIRHPGMLSKDGTFDVTFKVQENMYSYSFIHNWFNQVVDFNTGEGSPDDSFRGRAILNMYSDRQEGSPTLARWIYKLVYPVTDPSDTFEEGSEDNQTTDVTFSYSDHDFEDLT